MQVKRRRKPRSDCNYVIYSISDQTGNIYIGLTRKSESTPLKSAKLRLTKHISRAKATDLKRTLYDHMRYVGLDFKWKIEILEVVRGRKDAYARERDIIIEQMPNLNEQYIN